MIENFGNKVASQIWDTGSSKAVPANLHRRAKFILEIMNATSDMKDLKLKGQPPNLKLHKLTGNRKEEWSISLCNGTPWRITFKFKGGKFLDVKIEDYH